MQLTDTSIRILSQLKDLTSGLTRDQYTAELDILHDNSIGKHLRHIAEFFDLLVDTNPPGPLNYDKRPRDISLEEHPHKMVAKLVDLSEKVTTLQSDMPLRIEQSYSDSADKQIQIGSTVGRELSYNIEHAIHHMAIIKIAVASVFPKVALDPSFGIAFSTLRYQKHKKSLD